jgi:hypothetical protein
LSPGRGLIAISPLRDKGIISLMRDKENISPAGVNDAMLPVIPG